ncbi:hypothetical protein [Sphingomonas sp.]|uniref:hypothetical protein n=1 Tax=Sphingomonas sp. TaxID=28214 RepID=UPI001B11609A|nr:hypothetical protein [Sphingomonas sp.]MBO9712744.1 hypothetical protein [Sphingomonas sp.]
MRDEPRRDWIAVGLITLAGLGLRIAAARGGLWLDEAWSAVNAQEVGTALGVFLRINHDNNHHLNTLWLQLVGLDASPVVQRGLSIATGTLSIPLAALIASRQSAGTAVTAAILFAISPLLVTYGAEARGYAPMLFFLLIAVLLTARWLDDTSARVPAIPLFLAVLMGMFSQLTCVFGLVAIGLWVGWALLRSRKPKRALVDGARVLAPMALAAGLAIGVVLGAAHAAGTGLQVGSYTPFTFAKLGEGLGALMLSTFGGPVALVAALVLLAPPDSPGDAAGVARDRSFFLFALLIPVGVVLLQLGNSGAPRYLLLSGMGAVMLAAVHTAPRLAAGYRWRWPVIVALSVVIVASLVTDWRIAVNRRADPAAAIDAMVARAPGGAEVAVGFSRSAAVLQAGVAARRYPIRIVEAPCPATRFLYLDRNGGDPFPAVATRCGSRYHEIAGARPTGLSGLPWKLYERDEAPVAGR